MLKSVAANVGMRYAFARQSSISTIGFIAVCGLALSVAVLVVVVSVVNGFERELRERVFGVLPHLSLYGRYPLDRRPEDLEALRGLPLVASAAAFVQGAGLAASGDKVQGVLLTGIEPGGYESVSDIDRYLVYGDLDRLAPGTYGVILGQRLAHQLRVGVGDKVTIVLPSATVTPAGMFPRQKRFDVIDLMHSQSDLDSRGAYVHIADAQRLFRLGAQIHGYQLKLHDLFMATQAARESLAALGQERVFARSWMRTHGNLYQAIGMQKATMFVLLAFLVAVAAINLVSTLVMVVEQRGADVAILKTLGARTSTVIGSFLVLGILIGGVGTLLGLGVGIGIASALPGFFAWVNDSFTLDLMNQYFVTYLPVDIQSSDIVNIALTAFVLCLLSTLYPAWRVAGLLPSRVLAHE